MPFIKVDCSDFIESPLRSAIRRSKFGRLRSRTSSLPIRPSPFGGCTASNPLKKRDKESLGTPPPAKIKRSKPASVSGALTKDSCGSPTTKFRPAHGGGVFRTRFAKCSTWSSNISSPDATTLRPHSRIELDRSSRRRLPQYQANFGIGAGHGNARKTVGPIRR